MQILGRDDSEPEDELAPPPNLTRLPPLSPDVNTFAFLSIQRAARMFVERERSIHTVANETVFDLHDASRLYVTIERGFLRVKDGYLLTPDWRVGRVGKRYALRFLDESAGKWVDPTSLSGSSSG